MAKQLAVPQAQTSLAEALNRDGFVALDSIVDPGVMQAMMTSGEDKYLRATELRSRQETTHKSFWVRLLDEDSQNGTLPSDNPFVRFAIQRPLIHVLAAALGEVPQLSDVLLTLSEESSSELAYSQLWHRDFDDIRTIKLFVYLTDVPTTAFGPFTFLPGPASDQFGRSMHSHMSDDKVFRTIPKSNVKEMIAPRCSTFMVETSRCLHMGSRMAPGHHRLLYTATFVTVPRPYVEPAPRFRSHGELDLLTEAVLFRSNR